MATVNVKDISGGSQGEMELPETIFGIEPNEISVRQALTAYMGNRRSGTAMTKTRSDVRGGGAKPWAQKGTGRARAGSSRSPLWRGGGTTFGPIPRSYRTKVNRKVRRVAILSVLSARASEEAISVVDSLEFPEIKTKRVVEMLAVLDVKEKVLIVADSPGDNFLLSARNLPHVMVTTPESLNVYDLLGHGELIFSRSAVERVAEIYGADVTRAAESDG